MAEWNQVFAGHAKWVRREWEDLIKQIRAVVYMTEWADGVCFWPLATRPPRFSHVSRSSFLSSCAKVMARIYLHLPTTVWMPRRCRWSPALASRPTATTTGGACNDCANLLFQRQGENVYATVCVTWRRTLRVNVSFQQFYLS